MLDRPQYAFAYTDVILTACRVTEGRNNVVAQQPFPKWEYRREDLISGNRMPPVSVMNRLDLLTERGLTTPAFCPLDGAARRDPWRVGTDWYS